MKGNKLADGPLGNNKGYANKYQVKKPIYTESTQGGLPTQVIFDGITTVKGFALSGAMTAIVPSIRMTLPTIPVWVSIVSPVGKTLAPDRYGKASLPCKECHGLFFGPICFQAHKTNGRCDVLHTCTTCFARYKTEEEHTCWHAKCGNCKKVDDLREHQCYIHPVEEEDP